VEGIDVVFVALPWEHLAIGFHHQAGKLVDRTGRRVVAWNPLRIEQGERTCCGRHDFVHTEHAMGDVGGVDIDLQRACAVRHVLRRGDIVGMNGEGGASQRGGEDGGGKRMAFQDSLPVLQAAIVTNVNTA
jgi:hypothetical protein